MQQFIDEPSVHVSRVRVQAASLRPQPAGIVLIDAPSEAHDGILLDRVAAWASEGAVSFLRANKPVWRLEVTHHDADGLSPEAIDAVADSALVLRILESERRGEPVRPRRELVLRAMRRVTEALDLTPDEREIVHRSGYVWAVELGRWDKAGVAALDTRYQQLRPGIADLMASPCDPGSEARWSSLFRVPGPTGAAIAQARRVIGHHANRLGVFAEAEAILHYFLCRFETEP